MVGFPVTRRHAPTQDLLLGCRLRFTRWGVASHGNPREKVVDAERESKTPTHSCHSRELQQPTLKGLSSVENQVGVCESSVSHL